MESALTTYTAPAIIDLLKEEIKERLEIHKDVAKRAATLIIETLDNAIRIGWCLIDIRKEFRNVPGAFESFVERNLPIGRTQAYKYAQIARGFQRDEENLGRHKEMRAMLGLTPILLDVFFPVHLKQQILATNANSFADLMRTAGIAKPKSIGNSMVRFENKPAFLRFGKTLSMAWVRFNRINKESPIENWAPEEKRALKDDLKPLVELYNSLT
jgi:hypothetical protein